MEATVHGGRGSHQGNIAAERFHASRSGLTLRSAWMAKHGDPLPGGVNLEYLIAAYYQNGGVVHFPLAAPAIKRDSGPPLLSDRT